METKFVFLVYCDNKAIPLDSLKDVIKFVADNQIVLSGHVELWVYGMTYQDSYFKDIFSFEHINEENITLTSGENHFSCSPYSLYDCIDDAVKILEIGTVFGPIYEQMIELEVRGEKHCEYI